MIKNLPKKIYFLLDLKNQQDIILLASINMSQIITLKPLGETLKDAGLISTPQIEVALHDHQYYQDMRLGEILASRGWIKQETADFFAEEWVNLINQRAKHPLGFYFKKASLLNDTQIRSILEEQRQNLLRFGSTAVIKGFLKQSTVDFFLENLFPEQAKTTYFKNTIISTSKHIKSSPNQPEIDYITKEDITQWVILSTKHLTRR